LCCYCCCVNNCYPACHHMASEYAFVSWIGTIIVYIVFVAWAVLPSDVLHMIGVTYYPSKYYAVALPSLLISAGILLGVAYVGLNMWNTFDPEDIRTIEDSITRYTAHSFHASSKNVNANDHMGTPDITDVDISQVSLLLHSSNSSSNRKSRRHRHLTKMPS
jgi:phosphatidylinositol glycan class P protein